VGAPAPRDTKAPLTSGETSADTYLSSHPTLKFGGGSSSKQQWIAEILQPVLPPAKNARILEIGPGLGEALTYLIESRGYTDVDVLDNSAEVVAACRHIRGANVYLGEADAFLAAHPGAYDLILLYHVLEHFNREAVPLLLRAIRHALKPRGVVVVAVPNAAAPIIGADQQYFDFTHQTAFSPWSLEQVLRMSGFGTVNVRPVWPPRGGAARAVQRLVQQFVLALMRAYLKVFTGVPRPVLTHSMVAYGWK
jgi:SAM-dependent methyltransferase